MATRRPRKRQHLEDSGNSGNTNTDENKVDEDSPVIASFREIQKELDSRYDKNERIVKSSRDLTIHSKRIIFWLNRVPGAENKDILLKEGEKKLLEVKQFIKAIASELINEDPYRFARAFSPGVQEYVEALSFYHYLKNSCLISFKEVQSELEFTDEGENLCLKLNPVDFVLGIADLTGELMRLGINTAARGDTVTPFAVCKFLREVHDSLMALGNVNRDLISKMRTLNASLRKVERACYTLEVRGSEIPKHMLADLLIQSNAEDSNDY